MANHHTRQVPELSNDERQELQRWLGRSKTSQVLALRARIVLACAEGVSDKAVAERLETTRRGRAMPWRLAHDPSDALSQRP